MPERDALWALFAAYTIIFVLIFWFVTHLHRRTGAMERELRRLQDDAAERVERDEADSAGRTMR